MEKTWEKEHSTLIKEAENKMRELKQWKGDPRCDKIDSEIRRNVKALKEEELDKETAEAVAEDLGTALAKADKFIAL